MVASRISGPFRKAPVATAVLLALSSPLALAAVSSTQLPGVGYVVNGSATSGVSATTNTLTVTASATTPIVIQWGGSAPAATSSPTINANGTAGFNIGQNATVDFAGSAAPILNIDATGNPSQILGTLNASQGAAVYVANANGIVVGSRAVITAPDGLGLIDANLNTTNALNLFTGSSHLVGIDFTGATGGVTVNAGADLNGVGGGLLIAGAGNVNVAGAFVSQAGSTVYSINDGVPLTVDAGVGGYGTAGSFTVNDAVVSGNDGSFATGSSGGAASDYTYTDAPNSAVMLNLGTTRSPYNSKTGFVAYADGNILVASGSNLSNLLFDTDENAFNWTGTFTNEGILNYGDQSGSSVTKTTAASFLGYQSSYSKIHQNTTQAVSAGGFVNASSGEINSGKFTFEGDSFTNDGTIQMGQAATQTPALKVYAFSGGIDMGGTASVVSAGGYTGALYLSSVNLAANYTAGQAVSIGTALPMVSGGNFAVYATNVNVADSITVTSGGVFSFSPYGSSTADAAPVSGSFTLASGATIAASSISLGASGATHVNVPALSPAVTSYSIDGDLVANSTATPKVTLGGSNASVFNVSGSGSITAGSLTFNNLLGSVNNITTEQILANGFQVNAPQNGTVAIAVNADGSASQGFNLKVNGNASIDSGTTVAVETQTPAANNHYVQYLQPANANSNLVVQASGDLTVDAGTGADNYNLSNVGQFFQWPGLVYLQSNATSGSGLTVNAPIANAFAAQASKGSAGVFLVGNDITDTNPIYTNGNAGVVFAAPYSSTANLYPYASLINGVNPANVNPNLPMVYFAQPNPTVGNADFSFQTLGSFTNENGYSQEEQTFLQAQPGQ